MIQGYVRRTRARWLALLGMALMLMGASVAAAEALQPDPAWLEGRLDNGLHWQILNTPQRPSDRIELRLLVRTGSLQERPQQAGYAHFLEHMAFNGTARFPEQAIRELWQHAGLTFGDDLNAATEYDNTLYRISLPVDKPQLLVPALTWLSDVAGGLTLQPAQVSAERGVILGESLTRDKNQRTAYQQWWDYQIQGSPLAQHDPIGDAAVIRTATRERLQTFYRQWYTPDAMTLLISGNVDPRKVAAEIATLFAPLTGKRSVPVPPAVLPPLAASPVQISAHKQLNNQLLLVWDQAWQPPQDSAALADRWLSDLVRSLIRQRLNDAISQQGSQPISLALGCSVRYARESCALSVETDAEQRQKWLQFLASELGRLRQHGILPSELTLAHRLANDDLSRFYEQYARMTSADFIQQRLFSLVSGAPDLGPEQYQRLRTAFLQNLSLERVNQELQRQLAIEPVLVLMQPQSEPAQSADTLMQAWRFLSSQPQAALNHNESGAAAVQQMLATPPQVGQIAEQQSWPQWRMSRALLSNGLSVLVRQEPQAKDRIYLRLRARGGVRSLPAELLPASQLLGVWGAHGVGPLDRNQLQQFIEVNRLELWPLLNLSQHGLGGSADVAHLDAWLAMARQSLLAPKLDNQVLDDIRNQQAGQLTQYLSTAQGRFNQALAQHLFPHNHYAQLPTPAQLQQVSLKQLQALHQIFVSTLQDAELVVVGDVDPATVFVLTARYLGGIDLGGAPQWSRYPFLLRRSAPLVQQDNPEDRTLVVESRLSVPAMQDDLAHRLAHDMLLRIMQQRLDNRLREALGLTYGVTVEMDYPDTDMQLNLLQIRALVAPDKQEPAQEAIAEQLALLLENGISEQEFNQARGQVATSWQDLWRQPAAIVELLSQYRLAGYPLEEVMAVNQVLSEISEQTVRDLMLHYLRAPGQLSALFAPPPLTTPTNAIPTKAPPAKTLPSTQ
ncbi:MAG: M16 family metallopeptidase [Plesiomonas sp.]